MDKDRVKGKMKDVAGKVQRKVGQMTGSGEQQGKGAAKQVEGKIQNTAGRAKDALRDVEHDMERKDEEKRMDIQDRPRRRVA